MQSERSGAPAWGDWSLGRGRGQSWNTAPLGEVVLLMVATLKLGHTFSPNTVILKLQKRELLLSFEPKGQNTSKHMCAHSPAYLGTSDQLDHVC